MCKLNHELDSESPDWSVSDFASISIKDILDCPCESILESRLRSDQLAPLRFIGARLTLMWTDVFKGLWQNAIMLNLDCSDIWGTLALPEADGGTGPPLALRPTMLQGVVPHHPIIDVLPFTTMRDRILGALSIIDMDTLRQDVVFSGMRCWGHRPWDARGWELPAAFVDKWWWLLDQEIVDMTNFWREEREEAPLVWKGGRESTLRITELS